MKSTMEQRTEQSRTWPVGFGKQHGASSWFFWTGEAVGGLDGGGDDETRAPCGLA